MHHVSLEKYHSKNAVFHQENRKTWICPIGLEPIAHGKAVAVYNGSNVPQIYDLFQIAKYVRTTIVSMYTNESKSIEYCLNNVQDPLTKVCYTPSMIEQILELKELQEKRLQKEYLWTLFLHFLVFIMFIVFLVLLLF